MSNLKLPRCALQFQAVNFCALFIVQGANMRRGLMLLVLVAAVAGCSDPKTANESNFKVAIQQHLDVVYPRCYLTVKFPFSSRSDWLNTSRQLDALVSVGVVSATDAGNKEKTYELTELGRKFYKQDAVKGLSGDSHGGFCFGKATVTAVKQFSEPGDILGHKLSRVNYEYSVSDLPDWAQSEQVQAQFKELKADAGSRDKPLKAMDTVLLTNKGWVHEKQFRQ
ncbi:hypothetical protein [uncultured Herbaspirillum sp.]|uniref:hypothetical protein n=1 Tax=uncultured Herbaspirillum sp. TaxID=160236 RepID=UPI00261735F7|nr:hypothetical protein [uncultured Herbaspirillum sp.]